MLYTQLYDAAAPDRVVSAGVIGTGHFATATITQAQFMKRLSVPIVADLDIDAAQRAFSLAGVPADDIVIADSRKTAIQALEQGKRVIVADAMLMMDLPIDIVVESTGIPEVGAKHAQAAIRHGKHVAMVGKETDVTVGPILAHMAHQAGVVYTPVDGDQHGLLISLIEWVRELGLEIFCAGKARDTEFEYAPDSLTVSTRHHSIRIDADDLKWLGPLGAEDMQYSLNMRHSLLAALPQVGGFDLVEMALVANATGLLPDRLLESAVRLDSPKSREHGLLHCPALHTSEIPNVLCRQECGGILSSHNVIDAVTALRLPHEAGLGGGVFVVVGCDNRYSRKILTEKGCLTNESKTAALIYRPYHLCGVETPISLLNAALLSQSTYVTMPKQHVDVVASANRGFAAGEIIGDDHSLDLTFLMHQAEPVKDGAPVPIHLANGHRLVADVPAGTILTVDMIDVPSDSVLWTLRLQQDESQKLKENAG